ncbi:max-binding protein MNT isoform X1 [Chiloscyllium plagiosum]|uniref:max-binding protein MNT isoform X1 n=2 Tax=Chiloscyllium plagiosum TaxID=36176 RepID=UPI001CB7ED60|nr:max-binding protein MNT isoform X1 [Chiloscyllium plagiosum]
MSIETLLEAAMFLELQAQQQKTREEHEKRDKFHLDREPECKRTDMEIINNVLHIEEVKPELQTVPALPVPKPLLPPAVAATIVVPHVVSPSLAPSPLPPQVVQHHQPVVSPTNSTREISQSPPVLHRSPISALTDPQPGPPLVSSSPQQFTSSVLTIPPHHVIQPSALQQQPSGLKPSSVDDGKPQDQKRRPGGAGTREVHNKLEKNRRAHLKECFETLKKNIPNLDDKKTSNLSVLRSALRYIQTLKRKEKEYEHEMERLAREKIATQQRLADLKNELSQWMDILEVDRILRQTVQPEDDQASTSTASEGEDNIDDDIDDMRPINSLLQTPHCSHQDLLKAVSSPIAHQSSFLPPHLAVQQKLPQTQAQVQIQPQALAPSQTVVPAQTHIVTASTLQPTVIAHAAPASHASVIHTAVNHVIQASQAKHIAHIAPATSSSVQLTTAAQPIGHITVHPATLSHMAHLGQQLPTIYPQPMTVNQPVVSHLTHAITHQQVNGTAPVGQQAVVTKQAMGPQVVHQQIVGQTVLNPVTMVTMPSFPVSTLKLA